MRQKGYVNMTELRGDFPTTGDDIILSTKKNNTFRLLAVLDHPLLSNV